MNAAAVLPTELHRYHTDAVRHRQEHGCGGYPFEDGKLLQEIARRSGSARVLELGTAIGFSAYCWATAGPDVRVDTVDRDATHVALARERLGAAGVGERVTCHLGDFATVLRELEGPYDLSFFDGFEPDLDLVDALCAKTAQGIIVTANLSWSATAGAYLAAMDARGWQTERTGDLGISVKAA